MTLQELDFSSEFMLSCLHDETIHGVVVFFDVTFSKTDNKISFSTGPFDKYTHWKQTVFYLDSDLDSKKGDEIHGSIIVNRNEKNPRDLDIFLRTEFVGKRQKINQERLFRLR